MEIFICSLLPIGIPATKSAPSGLSRGARRPLGRFCSRTPRRCTPRNKRRKLCRQSLSRKAASATAVARANARRRRSPALYLSHCLVPPHRKFALKTPDYMGNRTADRRFKLKTNLIKNLPSFLIITSKVLNNNKQVLYTLFIFNFDIP